MKSLDKWVHTIIRRHTIIGIPPYGRKLASSYFLVLSSIHKTGWWQWHLDPLFSPRIAQNGPFRSVLMDSKNPDKENSLEWWSRTPISEHLPLWWRTSGFDLLCKIEYPTTVRELAQPARKLVQAHVCLHRLPWLIPISGKTDKHFLQYLIRLCCIFRYFPSCFWYELVKAHPTPVTMVKLVVLMGHWYSHNDYQ